MKSLIINIRRTALIFASLLGATAGAYASEPADTVASIDNPNRIIVTDDGTTTTVHVTGKENNPNYNFLYSVCADTSSVSNLSISLPIIGEKLSTPASRSVTFLSDIHVGIISPYDSPAQLKTSWEGGVDLVGMRYSFGRGTALGFGVGMSGRQLNFRRGTEALVENDRLVIAPAPAGAVDARTHLSVSSFQIPVYFRQRIYRSLAFKLSAVLNYNFTVRGESKYTLDGIEYTRKLKGLHQRLITPDFVFTIGTLDFGGLYVRWSPVSLFKSAYGPEIHTLSFGLSIAF